MESSNLPLDLHAQLAKVFNTKEMVPNGKVISLEYKEFQIDVILTPRHEMEAARTYYAYNDLGNLMGRIAHKFGLKYGHDGLFYMFRDGTHLIDEICITRTPKEVFEVFDFDYSRWCKGFDDLEDVFEFVAKSKYFNPGIYLFDQMNHRSRVRDAKRATYNTFLTWCAEKDWEGRVFFDYKKNKEEYLPFLFEKFAGDEFGTGAFKSMWYATYHKMLEQRDLKSKFNGSMVNEWTGLEAKDLGFLMKYTRESFAYEEDFKLFVAAASPSMMKEYTLSQYEKLKKEGVV
jgi:hypothetical protein